MVLISWVEVAVATMVAELRRLEAAKQRRASPLLAGVKPKQRLHRMKPQVVSGLSGARHNQRGPPCTTILQQQPPLHPCTTNLLQPEGQAGAALTS